MVDQAPTPVRARWIDWAIAGLVVLVLLGLSVKAMQPDLHPELLPKLAGCYGAASPHESLKLRLDASGVLEADGATTNFQIEKLKTGMVIAPDRGLTYGNAGSRGFDVGHVSPLFMDIDPDQSGFWVLNADGGRVHLTRKPC